MVMAWFGSVVVQVVMKASESSTMSSGTWSGAALSFPNREPPAPIRTW